MVPRDEVKHQPRCWWEGIFLDEMNSVDFEESRLPSIMGWASPNQSKALRQKVLRSPKEEGSLMFLFLKQLRQNLVTEKDGGLKEDLMVLA